MSTKTDKDTRKDIEQAYWYVMQARQRHQSNVAVEDGLRRAESALRDAKASITRELDREPC